MEVLDTNDETQSRVTLIDKANLNRIANRCGSTTALRKKLRELIRPPTGATRAGVYIQEGHRFKYTARQSDHELFEEHTALMVYVEGFGLTIDEMTLPVVRPAA
ncbi:hypothetical protein KIN20_033183 [Parelaphostrongylus tenuis]|uniref:Uncharacterized protein n=1 Tax=Parelaphostrongylus tenuis TaxID=148309 RepID=A0AAD5WI19_PARTN|nr:hypothetical protein KIN20_033183 [Parelaphostrongylus tenuis]